MKTLKSLIATGMIAGGLASVGYAQTAQTPKDTTYNNENETEQIAIASKKSNEELNESHLYKADSLENISKENVDSVYIHSTDSDSSATDSLNEKKNKKKKKGKKFDGGSFVNQIINSLIPPIPVGNVLLKPEIFPFKSIKYLTDTVEIGDTAIYAGADPVEKNIYFDRYTRNIISVREIKHGQRFGLKALLFFGSPILPSLAKGVDRYKIKETRIIYGKSWREKNGTKIEESEKSYRDTLFSKSKTKLVPYAKMGVTAIIPTFGNGISILPDAGLEYISSLNSITYSRDSLDGSLKMNILLRKKVSPYADISGIFSPIGNNGSSVLKKTIRSFSASGIFGYSKRNEEKPFYYGFFAGFNMPIYFSKNKKQNNKNIEPEK